MKYEVLKIAVIAGAVHSLGEIIEMEEHEAKKFLDDGVIGVVEAQAAAEVKNAEAEKIKAEAEAKNAKADAEVKKGK